MEDVAVAVGVLEDWVLEVGVEFPAGLFDELPGAVDGGGAGDEVDGVGLGGSGSGGDVGESADLRGHD